MNPSAQQNLDPKLKEAYDRVMGAELPKAASSPGSETGQTLTPTTSPFQPPQPAKNEQHQQPASSGPQPIININSSSSPTKPQRVEKVKGKGISPVIFITLGILFFGGYTLIWLKVFKIF